MKTDSNEVQRIKKAFHVLTKNAIVLNGKWIDPELIYTTIVDINNKTFFVHLKSFELIWSAPFINFYSIRKYDDFYSLSFTIDDRFDGVYDYIKEF